MITEIAPSDWIVSTNCHECFIRVEASQEPDSRWISLRLLSHHDDRWRYSLRGRLSRAWGILRGEGDPWFELNSADEVEDLMATLVEAHGHAFPEPGPHSNGHG